MTFKNMLTTVMERLPDRRFRAFWPQIGKNYKKGEGTLFVGQAVGPWGKDWKDGVWFDDGHHHDVKAIRAYSEEPGGDDTCPLAWFERHLSGSFRPTVRRLTRGQSDEQGWSSRIAWTNLYKVAPGKRGNPRHALTLVQYDACRSLLDEEIHQLQPRRVVVLAGKNWFEPFFPLRGSVIAGLEKDPLKIGMLRSPCIIVLAPHPSTAHRNRVGLADFCRQIERASPE